MRRYFAVSPSEEAARAMRMNPGELWRCCNLGCRSEVVIQTASVEGENPRCGCGAAMKRDYQPPVLRYLEFLQLEEPDHSSANLKE